MKTAYARSADIKSNIALFCGISSEERMLSLDCVAQKMTGLWTGHFLCFRPVFLLRRCGSVSRSNRGHDDAKGAGLFMTMKASGGVDAESNAVFLPAGTILGIGKQKNCGNSCIL